ncbi:MAG: 2-oxoacid:acceptor oxidoreductase family protein [Bacteroidales bacterium]
MNEEILIAGFGGQGVLSMGKILAYAGMMQGNEVCWMPSYGPEMRGGTANVTVIIGNKSINSPILQTFDTIIILNQQSLDKFENAVRPGGKLFYDSNGIKHLPTRRDINIYHIPATAKSVEMGNIKVFNIMVLGGLLQKLPIVDKQFIEQGLYKSLPERAHSLIPLNMKAFTVGGTILETIHEV